MGEYTSGRARLAAGARNRLADRLRSLRVGAWPGLAVTQRQVAQALRASAPLVSSWESPGSDAVPPVERLRAYAQLFATQRSVAADPARLIDLRDLTPDEEARRTQLLTELLALRQEAVGLVGRGSTPRSFWHFGDDEPIRVISTVLPQELVSSPYASPWHPNFIPTLHNADMDAVLAVYGQIRAENPDSKVTWVRSDRVTGEEFNSHVVILGGGDGDRDAEGPGDPLTYYRRRLDMPVFARRRPVGRAGPFDQDHPLEDELDREYVVTVDSAGRPDYSGAGEQVYRPRFVTLPGSSEPRRGPDGHPMLEYDVGLLARQPNEMNLATTVTVCSGIFSRGTFGVVRSVTDPQMRDQNLAQLGELVDEHHFWLLMFVPVFVGGEGLTTLTPDLSRPLHVLAHSGPSDDDASFVGGDPYPGEREAIGSGGAALR